MAGTKGAKEQRRKQAVIRQQELERYLVERKRKWILIGAAALAVVGLALGLGFGLTGGAAAAKKPPASSTTTSSSSTTTTTSDTAPLSTLGTLRAAPAAGALGPEGVPVPSAAVLAAAGTPSGKAIDGISCAATEPTAYRAHVHLTIVVDGKPRQVPIGIGVRTARTSGKGTAALVTGGQCQYWIHTHASDGIVEITAPSTATFSLGNLFDIWGQKLTRSQVGSAMGVVVAVENGKVVTGDLATIPFTNQASIELEVGKPLVTPQTVVFPKGL